ncbi:MAG: hypothetical protein KGO53_09950 [Alphaproteobacteria bacterium]|nr:hypothetical protein [Alphaproteobacteria bacterium]
MGRLFSKSSFIVFCADDAGSNAIEYCIMACTLGLALLPIFNYLTGTVSTQFSNLSSHIASGK